MNCSNLWPQCHAECCGPCPIPVATWKRHQADIQGTVETAMDDGEGFIHAVTTDGRCVFLQANYRCAIYPAEGEPDERAEVCGKLGDESHLLMTCRWQDKNGRVRSRGERRQLGREIEREMKRVLGDMRRSHQCRKSA